MATVDEMIKNTDNAICRHIHNLTTCSRGEISQDILAQLRNLTEAVMLKFKERQSTKDVEYKDIQDGIKYANEHGELKSLTKLHNLLQMVASHYTLNEEESERLMIKYCRYLIDVKMLVKKCLGLDILQNISKFPKNIDRSLQEYYDKIAALIDDTTVQRTKKTERCYVWKNKPFFVNGKVYYEVALTIANDNTRKTDRIIAFTNHKLLDNYAINVAVADGTIQMLGRTMSVDIIVDWKVAIRGCEFNNFSIIVTGKKTEVTALEQKVINNCLTQYCLSLCDIVDFTDKNFNALIQTWQAEAKSTVFSKVLLQCRKIIKEKQSGQNVLRYLLYCMNNTIIKAQRSTGRNNKLSDLYLQSGCIPFDTMPLAQSLKEHNPRLFDLLDCFYIAGREYELFARRIKNNTETEGKLFTSVKDFAEVENIDSFVRCYNDKLWSGHKEEGKLVIEKGQIFINGYKNDTCFVVNKLRELSCTGIKNYEPSVESWLSNCPYEIDCEEKRDILKNLFSDSHVAIVYGSAGVGKSTFANLVAHLFADSNKLVLTETNSAVDNLKRKITASNCRFMTITTFLSKHTSNVDYDLVVIDECSTVSNNNMRKVLSKVSLKLLLLIGDTYQISSIRFGNWFAIAKNFLADSCIFELTTPYRGNGNKSLLTLWNRARKMQGDVKESLVRNRYSAKLDSSIFKPHTKDNEIILCLNYDGLYGINNINRFLQDNNMNEAVQWGLQNYKIGDPVLFSESDKFAPLIYNNLKGKIVGIKKIEQPREMIQFDIELPRVINSYEAERQNLTLVEGTKEGTSIVRFVVNKNKNTDEDNSEIASNIVPFQVAYAVSIHKAQGLEYDSVKIVISDEIDELITHSIFYTAITRTKDKLKIYWTPEVEEKVLSRIKPRDVSKDVSMLQNWLNVQ